VPCCQRCDSHPGCRGEKNLDGFGVFLKTAVQKELLSFKKSLLCLCAYFEFKFVTCC
jgi:hypothetical protein